MHGFRKLAGLVLSLAALGVCARFSTADTAQVWALAVGGMYATFVGGNYGEHRAKALPLNEPPTG